MFAVHRNSTCVAKYEHRLVNSENQEVVVTPGETVKVLMVQCILGVTYCAIQKKTKGLILLPFSLFKTFNNFKESL